jgi:hypothetical protein
MSTKTARCVPGEWVAPSEMVYQLGSCNQAHEVSGPTVPNKDMVLIADERILYNTLNVYTLIELKSVK